VVDRNIPTSRLVTCEGCGMQLDSLGRDTFQMIEAWQNAYRRTQVLKVRGLPRYICDVCADRVKHHDILGQRSFLDATYG